MANMLPLDAQKKIRRMYRARVIATLSFALFALAVLALVALIPSYIALRINAPASVAATPSHVDGQDPTAITRAQILVANLFPILSSTTSPTEIILSALADRPQSVVVDHISYTAGDSSTGAVTSGQLILDGAALRDQVSAYRDRLSSDPYFTGVSVPVGALVGAVGGRFSITAVGNF